MFRNIVGVIHEDFGIEHANQAIRSLHPSPDERPDLAYVELVDVEPFSEFGTNQLAIPFIQKLADAGIKRIRTIDGHITTLHASDVEAFDEAGDEIIQATADLHFGQPVDMNLQGAIEIDIATHRLRNDIMTEQLGQAGNFFTAIVGAGHAAIGETMTYRHPSAAYVQAVPPEIEAIQAYTNTFYEDDREIDPRVFITASYLYAAIAASLIAADNSFPSDRVPKLSDDFLMAVYDRLTFDGNSGVDRCAREVADIVSLSAK